MPPQGSGRDAPGSEALPSSPGAPPQGAAPSAQGAPRVRLSRPRGPWPTRLLCPWDPPGKSAGVGCHSLLQGIFPTEGLNPVCLLHWQAGSLPPAPLRKFKGQQNHDFFLSLFPTYIPLRGSGKTLPFPYLCLLSINPSVSVFSPPLWHANNLLLVLFSFLAPNSPPVFGHRASLLSGSVSPSS